TPKDDPAALAFSAVENALKDSVFSMDDKPARKVESQPATREPKRDQRRENPTNSERLRAADKIAAQASSVANDDRSPAASAFYALQTRASNAPVWFAIVASVLWMAGVGLIAAIRYGNQFAEGLTVAEFVQTLDFAALAAIIALPILAMISIAFLVRRAQDLRLAAASMTQAAMRLSEPESAAAHKIATVGQAVRREVNAIGDGLERALSRAGELEVMVHNEVTALERTYSDNETRMRQLIEELSSQRDAVVTNSERMRDTIVALHGNMASEINEIGTDVTERLRTVGTEVASAISERGTTVARSIEDAGATIETTFERRGQSFTDTVETRTADLIMSLDDTANRLDSRLSERTENLASAIAQSS